MIYTRTLTVGTINDINGISKYSQYNIDNCLVTIFLLDSNVESDMKLNTVLDNLFSRNDMKMKIISQTTQQDAYTKSLIDDSMSDIEFSDFFIFYQQKSMENKDIELIEKSQELLEENLEDAFTVVSESIEVAKENYEKLANIFETTNLDENNFCTICNELIYCLNTLIWCFDMIKDGDKNIVLLSTSEFVYDNYIKGIETHENYKKIDTENKIIYNLEKNINYENEINYINRRLHYLGF